MVWFRSSLPGLAGNKERTSEPPHYLGRAPAGTGRWGPRSKWRNGGMAATFTPTHAAFRKDQTSTTDGTGNPAKGVQTRASKPPDHLRHPGLLRRIMRSQTTASMVKEGLAGGLRVRKKKAPSPKGRGFLFLPPPERGEGWGRRSCRISAEAKGRAAVSSAVAAGRPQDDCAGRP